MSLAEQDRAEALRAQWDYERYGELGSAREIASRSDPLRDHPRHVCLCPGCKAWRAALLYPGPCAGCGSELRRKHLSSPLLDGQGSVLCRAGYLHTSTPVRDTPSTPVSNLPHGGA